MAQGEPHPPLFLHRPDHPAEQVKLPPGIGPALLVLLVGHGEVGEDALRLQPRQAAGLTDALHAAVKVTAVAEVAQPGHAGVHLDVDFQGPAQGRGLPAVFQGLGLAGDRLGNVVLHQPSHLLLGGVAQDQHRHGHAVGPQLHGLVDAGHRQIVGSQLLEGPGHLHGPVAVGVGLHHAQEADLRPDMLPQAAIVVGQSVQVDLRPGSL